MTVTKEWGFHEARQVAYNWSAGSGSGLFLYSFASLGCVIAEDEHNGNYRPLIMAEIEEAIEWSTAHPEWHSVDDVQDLLRLQAYVALMDVTPAGHIMRHMADGFLLNAWADFADEHNLVRPGHAYSQDNLPTPSTELRYQAEGLAIDLYQAIADQWAKQLGRPISIPDAINAWVGSPSRPHMARLDAYRDWAHNAVLSAIGTGAFWGDNRPDLEIDGQKVEVKARLGNLIWSE